MQGVDQRRGRDDRRAVLVVMEHRNVEQFAQALLDDEAFRRLDVFQIDAAPALAEEAHAIDELLDILGVDLEVDAVHVGEALEQDGLALHHRLRRQRADVAEAEHGGAVRDHRDEVAARGVVVPFALVLLDLQAGRRHTRRISQGEVVGGRQRLGRDDLDLARTPGGVHPQRLDVEIGHGFLGHSLPPGRAFSPLGPRTRAPFIGLILEDRSGGKNCVPMRPVGPSASFPRAPHSDREPPCP
jgi:hypothetical protein